MRRGVAWRPDGAARRGDGATRAAALASRLAEIGVILLMLGVGLHFSFADLWSVRRIAMPGAIGQVAVATVLGAIVTHFWGWWWDTGLVFGLSLSVASTVVLLRALVDRGILESVDGRIAVGWLIVEDRVTVLALVLLPALAGVLGAGPAAAAPGAAGAHAPAAAGSLLATVGITLLEVTLFGVLMIVVGRRAVPWLLRRVVRTGSHELFTLAVLAVALGIAVGAAALLDVSFALGTFFAGVIVSESDFSHEAATNALPLQDAFAVLFFVSVGMLFDPRILLRQPLEVLAVVLIVLFGKSLAAFAIVLAFRYSLHTALTISASLAQIGEFSFILAALGVSLGLLPPAAQSLIVAGALLSITLDPFLFGAVDPLWRCLRARRGVAEALERPVGAIADLPAGVDPESLRDHVVIVGSGRAGAPVAAELAAHGIPHVVIEQRREMAESLRERGLPVMYGDATRPEVLAGAHIERARLVVVAAPDVYQARHPRPRPPAQPGRRGAGADPQRRRARVPRGDGCGARAGGRARAGGEPHARGAAALRRAVRHGAGGGAHAAAGAAAMSARPPDALSAPRPFPLRAADGSVGHHLRRDGLMHRTHRIARLGRTWIVAALAAVPAALPAQAAPVVGRWDLRVTGPEGPYPSWLEVSLSGNRTLVGRFVGGVGSARPIGHVHFADGVLRFAIPPQWEPDSGDLRVEGRLDGDRMSGTLVTPGGERHVWTATRAPHLRRTAAPNWGAPVALFDGRGLDGWATRGGENRWRVVDGVLTNAGGGGNLVTTRTFEDFRLQVEFRYPKGSNSGVYLRGRYEVQIEDSAERLEPGPLHVGGIYGFLPPNENAAKAPGEWQRYDITLVGRRVTVVLNGRTIIADQAIPGITGGALDSDEGSPGPILLQGDHGPVEFRRIVLTPAR